MMRLPQGSNISDDNKEPSLEGSFFVLSSGLWAALGQVLRVVVL